MQLQQCNLRHVDDDSVPVAPWPTAVTAASASVNAAIATIATIAAPTATNPSPSTEPAALAA